MNIRALGVIFGLSALAFSNASSAAFLACVAESVCDQRAASAYQRGLSEGTAVGQTSGFDQGFGQGFTEGSTQGTAGGIAACQVDPASCGITLASVLPPAQFGETEFNDNMVSADPLVVGATFWGQSYGPEDEDWYYLVTTTPNSILTIYFSVPDRDPATQNASGWIVQVRDAAGNLYAEFSTDFIADNPNGDDEIAYPVTVGFASTYYVVVLPNPISLSHYPYNLSVVVQESSLDSPNFIVGAYDAEVEPNNLPSQANPLASQVTMYGLVNLTFDVPVPQEDTFVWGQGEADWYAYDTSGDEIVTLSFCEREICGQGNWFVDVYDAAGATALEGGANERSVTPLLAYNTDVSAKTASDSGNSESIPFTVRFGLANPGRYFMRVDHKRKLEAPCLDERNVQECLNPSGACLETVCRVTDDPAPDGVVNVEGTACTCGTGSSCRFPVGTPARLATCECRADSIPNCGIGNPDYEGSCWEQKTECLLQGRVVEIPDTEVSSQYNFTWSGTKLSPFTVESEAYQDLQNRPSPYNP